MKNQTFHIIGGGIAGLASALAIANSGNRAIVMEKAEKFEAVGAGLQLGPNAVRALKKLGAWDVVEQITSSPPEIHIRDGKSGKTLKRVPLGKTFERRFGQPYRVAHRGDLLLALLQVAQSHNTIEIHSNSEVTDSSVFENVIAADSVWSKTRERLFPGTAAVGTHEIFHRALIPDFAACANDSVNLWLYPGGHVVHYPVGHPAKLNLVAITQGQDVATHFANACDTLKVVLALAKNWQQWPAAYVQPLKRWNNDKTLLIGDAAHATLPYLAQGAAMALEDAAALEINLNADELISQAFDKLSKNRVQRTRHLLNASLRTGRIYHCNSLVAAARNLTLKTMPSQLFLQQLAWIYCGD